MKKIFLILISLCLSAQLHAQVFSGTTAGQFLKIEAGAKAIAMGGAFVSQANDASTIYWNPGGISRLEGSVASFSHNFWLADTRHDFAAVIIKLNEMHSLAVSYTSLSMNDMNVRTEMFPEGTGELFSASDYAIGISYGLNLTDRFSIGFTGKYVGQSIWHMSASTFAFDVGVLYSTPIQGLQMGMSVSNIGGKMKYDGSDNFVNYDYNPAQTGNSDKIFAELKMDQWALPLFFRFGVSMQVLKDEYNSIIISADANHPNDYGESVNTGIEYGFRGRVFLRGGYKSLFKKESEEGLTAGAGLVYYVTEQFPVRVDYAYEDFGRLKAIHRFSVEIGF
ncbi:MAG: PorV/PorQ family protein [Ignavibacteria bacterium]|jgi:opacity protein-like surface antigen|nr:PorV/PorQ family protein [Ignavibacteria bacterium]MCU7504564.1 PorV/PorQ family protein [Ignavibacteria bacterium]MCU7516598.1 PorV/PorQ family protein [Ignavibacteria bacterium]